ncbi:GPW/gp25 family protein [Microvirga puerhi]|uniref:GPW/gp25 family protein n=1 Tax=Microvirga puerhi TaxID=2876078 RepID=A0ABS7VUV5_9HYPH|nr:GPW/gp25 family protein [Microvirga puerhi]MBZ6078954.1 GPW/gp25 family protein [Microvirga puerhi]
MAGTDRRTGKWIASPAHIRQSIEVILTTPVGTRVMRREFGFDAIHEDGRPKEGLTADSIEESARAALIRWEPRVEFRTITAILGGKQTLAAIKVSYQDKETGDTDETTVLFPVSGKEK